MTTKRQRSLAAALTHFVPQAPFFDAEAVRGRAAAKHMRSLKAETAVWLALIAYIRHTYTPYDSLRDEGYEHDAARFFVHDAINAKLQEWRACRFLQIDENEAEQEENGAATEISAAEAE